MHDEDSGGLRVSRGYEQLGSFYTNVFLGINRQRVAVAPRDTLSAQREGDRAKVNGGWRHGMQSTVVSISAITRPELRSELRKYARNSSGLSVGTVWHETRRPNALSEPTTRYYLRS